MQMTSKAKIGLFLFYLFPAPLHKYLCSWVGSSIGWSDHLSVSQLLMTLSSRLMAIGLVFWRGISFWAAAPTGDKFLKNGEKFRSFVRLSIPSLAGPQTLLAGPQTLLAGPQTPPASPQTTPAGPQATPAGPQGLRDRCRVCRPASRV